MSAIGNGGEGFQSQLRDILSTANRTDLKQALEAIGNKKLMGKLNLQAKSVAEKLHQVTKQAIRAHMEDAKVSLFKQHSVKAQAKTDLIGVIILQAGQHLEKRPNDFYTKTTHEERAILKQTYNSQKLFILSSCKIIATL